MFLCVPSTKEVVGGPEPPTDPGTVVLNEVYYDAIGADAGEVFTELFGPAGMSLSGWSLVGINGNTGLEYITVDLTGAVIPTDGLLVIAEAEDGVSRLKSSIS